MEAGDPGRIQFWKAVAWLWLSMLGRDLARSPIAMAASSAIAWFVYMGLSLVLAFALYIIVALVWGVAYVLANHTGFELLADVLRIRFEWPPIPDGVTWVIQAVVLFAIAPFHIGRGGTNCWRGRELSAALVTLFVWTLMAVFVPLVGVGGIRAYPSMVPVMVMFVLAGALFERSRRTVTSTR